MKGLNKLALATAVAAAPFATQAMEPMSDDAMGNTTGQAGVTIELDTQVSIDRIDYSQGDATGSFLIDGVDVGGIDGVSEGLDLAINVDLVEDGTTAGFPDIPTDSNGLPVTDPNAGASDPSTASISTPASARVLSDGDALISVKNLANDSSEMVDLGVSVDALGLGDSTTTASSAQQATLVSDFNVDIFASKLDIIARTEDLGGNTGNEGSLGVDVAFAIDDLNADVDVAAVDITGLRMAGAGTLDTLKDGGDVNGVTGSGANAQAEVTPAIVSMDIGSGGSLSADGPDETLRISLANFQSDIYIDEIGIGNQDADGNRASIGSVGISNLQITDTEIAVYGRD